MNNNYNHELYLEMVQDDYDYDSRYEGQLEVNYNIQEELY